VRNNIEIDVKKLPKRCRSFVEDTITYANENGCAVRLLNADTLYSDVAETMPVEGYLEGDGKLLSVACGSLQPLYAWIGVLCHESCHLDQFLQNKPLWNKMDYYNSDALNMFDDWIAGKKYKPRTISSCVSKIQQIELDCEERTVEKILCYDLPIDLNYYIPSANAYIMLYRAVSHLRRWYTPGKEPHNNLKIVRAMPGSFLSLTTFANIPKDLLTLYDQAM